MNYIYGNLSDGTNNTNYIILDKVSSTFAFRLKSETGEATAYCNLTPEECEVFSNVFSRIANSVNSSPLDIGENKEA